MKSLTPPASHTHAVSSVDHSLALATLTQLLSRILGMAASLVAMLLLTRGLGPEQYGVYSLAAGFVVWAKMALSQMFAKPTLRMAALRSDWRAVSGAVARLQFALGLGAAIILAALSPLLSGWLRVPALAAALALFVLEIPIGASAEGLYYALLGRRRFWAAFGVNVIRETARAGLSWVALLAGLAVTGAVLANLGAGLLQLGLALAFLPVIFSGRASITTRKILMESLPFLAFSIGLQLFRTLDLAMVQAAGLSAAKVGVYSAAQNLATIPMSFLSAALSNGLLVSLTGVWRGGRQTGDAFAAGHHRAHQALRLGLCSLPFLAAFAGCAGQLSALVFGPAYFDAGAPAAWLGLAGLGLLLFTYAMTLVMAVDGPAWTFSLTLVMLAVASPLEWWLAQKMGITGAGLAVCAVAWLGAVAMLLVARGFSGVGFAWGALWRCLAAALPVLVGSMLWQTAGWKALVELAGMGLVSIVLLSLTGAIQRSDWREWRDSLGLQALMRGGRA